MPRKPSAKSRPATVAEPSPGPQQPAPEALPVLVTPAKSKTAASGRASNLTRSEAKTLLTCEQTIQQGIHTFHDVGKALFTIRDQRLYRQDYRTFKEYCQDKWSFTDGRAKQLIAAAKTADEVETVTNVTIPNEAVAREINRTPPQSRAAVLREAASRTGGHPTASTIRQVVAEQAALACPNCGGNTVTEDGDCAQCHEPAIGSPAPQEAATPPAHEQAAARDDRPQSLVACEEGEDQTATAVPTEDKPAKVRVRGEDFEVYRDGTQWFFRRPTGTGWTCASVEFVKLIEDSLPPTQTASQEQAPVATEKNHFDLPTARCRLMGLAQQIESELTGWPPEHLGEASRILGPLLNRLPAEG